MLQALALAVVLHLSNIAGAPAQLVATAQTEVARTYSAMGVPIVWRSHQAITDARAIQVVLLPLETGGLRQSKGSVMGAAVHTPEGTGVAYVYYRRVAQQAQQYDVPYAMVLASAIAHELGHLLLGSHEHAPAGLMRACWRREEFRQAAQGRLRFSAAELAAIRTRLDAFADE